MSTSPAEDSGRKKRTAPWSPDEIDRDNKKKGDGTTGYCAVDREREVLDTIPEGAMPRASPASLRQRVIIKVRRKTGGGGDTAYSIIKMQNGNLIPFIEKPVTTLSVLTEPGADLEKGFTAVPFGPEQSHSRIQLLQGMMDADEKARAGVAQTPTAKGFCVYLARNKNPEGKEANQGWIDRGYGHLTLSPQSGHLLVYGHESKRPILNATVPLTKNPWGVTITSPSASSSPEFAFVVMLDDTSGVSLGRRTFQVMFANHHKCMRFLDLFMRASARPQEAETANSSSSSCTTLVPVNVVAHKSDDESINGSDIEGAHESDDESFEEDDFYPASQDIFLNGQALAAKLMDELKTEA